MCNMKYQNKMLRGFTLIELVLVLFIIAIVAAISLSTLLYAQSGQVFSNNFETLVSFLNNARTDAITAKGQPDYVGKNTTKFVTPANYGVDFATNTAGVGVIKLFSDTNPPISGATGQKLRFNKGTIYATGDDLVLKTYTFPKNYILNVDAISSDLKTKIPNSNNNNPVAIFYSPLYADIYAENIKIDQSNNPPPSGSFPFIRIKLIEKQPPNRCRQILIHQISGVLNIGPCKKY